MNGEVALLNVGVGDIKLSFDKRNPAEAIRAGRVVRDLLRRGYALLVEVERDGEKVFQRAIDFDEEHQTYLIADYDPLASVENRTSLNISPAQVPSHEETGEILPGEATASRTEAKPPRAKRGRARRIIPASSTRAVAVARSAGG